MLAKKRSITIKGESLAPSVTYEATFTDHLFFLFGNGLVEQYIGNLLQATPEGALLFVSAVLVSYLSTYVTTIDLAKLQKPMNPSSLTL